MGSNVRTISHEQRQRLLSAALEVRSMSYSPYSKFPVGAAVLLQNGDIVQGANVENASYGGTICAERTAIVKAATSYEHFHQLTPPILAIAIASNLDGPCSPCGICRQVMREFCSLSTPVLMVATSWSPSSDEQAEETGVTVRTLAELLPLSFGPEDLQY